MPWVGGLRVVVDCTLRRNGGGEIGSFVANLRLEEAIIGTKEPVLGSIVKWAPVRVIQKGSELMFANSKDA